MPNLGLWDILLMVAVPLHATSIAYVHSPQRKALILALPIPFTLAALALGRAVDVTHVSGLALLLAFTSGVYLLHGRLRINIILSIAVCAAGYCLAGMALSPRLPRSEPVFWGVWSGVLLTALLLYAVMPPRREPGHRSPLPVWIKLPAVAVVIFGLIAIKGLLSGFMAVFPMLTVVTAYEARHSLWTIFRQIPVIMLSFLPMLAVVHLAWTPLGRAAALAAGLAVYLPVLFIALKRRRGVDLAADRAKAAASGEQT